LDGCFVYRVPFRTSIEIWMLQKSTGLSLWMSYKNNYLCTRDFWNTTLQCITESMVIRPKRKKEILLEILSQYCSRLLKSLLQYCDRISNRISNRTLLECWIATHHTSYYIR
jgi:hypothetical protein